MTMIRIVTMLIGLLRSICGFRHQSPGTGKIKLLDLASVRAALVSLQVNVLPSGAVMKPNGLGQSPAPFSPR